MATKSNTGESASQAPGAESTADALRDSAEKIWLAGLGAFERMKSEGPRMFETLVEQGRNMSARAKDTADQALKSMREADFQGQGRWDKLQQDLQERFAKSLGTLGVTTTRQVEELSKQVAELNEHVRQLMSQSARGGSRKPSRSPGAAKKKAGPARKKASPGRKKARARQS
ncbi:MAG: phasin family protein [Betaproteobacteria bacterium]